MGVEVTGKTLGLIGAGNIGAIVASRALGLKMKVVAYDPFLTEERAVELGVEKVNLDTLLGRADFVSLHTPLTEQTRNILSRERLENAIAALPDTQRDVFLMNRIEKLTYREIAERLSVSVKAIEKRMSKALKQLSKLTKKI